MVAVLDYFLDNWESLGRFTILQMTFEKQSFHFCINKAAP